MKRFLALALTLILAFSLSIPAMAATDDYWNGVQSGVSDGYDAGYEDAMAGKAPAYPAADTYDGGYDDGYVQGYISGYEEAQVLVELRSSEGYSDGYEQGYADAYDEVLNGTYHPYPDAYYEDEGYSLGYDEGYEAGINAAWESGIEIPEWDPLTDFGGTAGKVNVMLNGVCIDFGDVWPGNRGGRVLAPVRAVLEALGATVEYDLESHTVSAELDGNLLLHQVGTASVEVYAGGDTAAEPEIITMDCTSVISGGRTLVPVRFFSEALGFDVYWDGEYRTVVLIDPDFLPDVFDGDLTVLNLLLATASANQKPDGYSQLNTAITLDATVFDTLNGDTVLGGSANLEAVYGQEGLEATLKVDLQKLFEVLRKQYGNDANIREMASMLEQTELGLRFDAATEQLYIGGDLLGTLTGLPGAWYQQDLAGSGWRYGQTRTAADLALQLTIDAGYTSPLFYVSETSWALVQITEVLGDDQFTQSGSTYTYRYEAEGTTQPSIWNTIWLLNGYGYYGAYGAESTSMVLTVTDLGDGTCSYRMEAKYRNESMAQELTVSGDAAGSDVSFRLHLRNTIETVLTAHTTVQPTTTKPETVPKDLDASLALEELPNFYM